MKGLVYRHFSCIERVRRVSSTLMQSMSDLPDDIEILKQIVIEQRGRLLSNTLQIEQLKLQLAKLRRIQFGRSSEQIDAQIAQLELILKISKFDPQRRHSRSLQRCLNG